MKYDVETWKQFIDIISNITSVGFSDIIIRNQQIRQLNDSKNLIILCEPVVSEDIQLQLAKAYIPLLKSFSSSETIEVNADDSFINIKDDTTEVKLVKPDIKLLSCEYLDDERFSKLNLDSAETVFELEVTESILQKILAIKDIFSASLFSLKTNKNGKTELRIDSWKKTGKSKILSKQSELPEGELKGNAAMFDFKFDDEPKLSVIKTTYQYIAILEGKLNETNVKLFSVLNT